MMKNDHDIDLDELDELPDVVLGEKTRAMRIEREGNGKARLVDPLKEPEKKEEKKKPQPSDEFRFTRSIDVDEVKKEEEKTEQQPVLKRRRYQKSEDDLQAALEEKSAELSENKKKVKTEEPSSEQEKTQILYDPVEESPASIIDDDPGVDDELSSLYDEDEEDDGATVAINPAESTSSTEVMDQEDTAQETSTESDLFDTSNQTTSELVYEDEEEEEKKPRRKKRRHSPLHTIVVAVLVILLVLLCVSVYGLSRSLKPVSSERNEVTVTVEDGELLPAVTEKLQESGVIRNDQIAYLYAKFKHYNSYTAGDHIFYTDMTLDEVFEELAKTTDNSNVARVTVIEGDWAKDIATKFSEVTNVSYDDLIALWNNADWIRSKMNDYPFLTEDMFNDGVRIYLEGYLAPDTYEIYKETTAEEITCKMLDQSLNVYNQYKDDIASSGHSIHEIYTMASIIQYEAGTNPDDLAKVASVFYNRLNAGMNLGSSVTVCYAIDFDSQTDGWQACELNSDFDSPYNTYMYDGLPPGAIENAGSAALNAAVHPADTDYYYFMADVCGDGAVHYAETEAEHNENVNKYLSDISNGCN